MKVILYSTHCPKCNILCKKLEMKNVAYDEVTDVSLMISKGFMEMPMLEVDGTLMDFKSAINWVNSMG